MKFLLSSSVIAFLAVVAPVLANPVANPIPTTSAAEGTQVGPLPIDELRAKVANMKVTEHDLGKRVSEGVHMCDAENFSGSCYWGNYPISTGIVPDPYWQVRSASVGPDNGGWCIFYK
jgi:hypothetical protein